MSFNPPFLSGADAAFWTQGMVEPPVHNAKPGGISDTMLLDWSRGVTDQLSTLVADVASLRHGLEETQLRLQHVAEQRIVTDSSVVIGAPWREELLKHGQDLHAQFSEGIRAAELNTAMGLNRIASNGASEAAQRESVLRHVINTELAEMRCALQHDCKATENACNARLESALSRVPRFEEDREFNQRNFAGLMAQVQGVGARLSGVEDKGAQLARWLDSEARGGRAGLADLVDSVDTLRMDNAELRESLKHCSEDVANVLANRSSCSSIAVVAEGSGVTATQLAEHMQVVEMQTATAIARAIATEESSRDKSLQAFRSEHERDQERLEQRIREIGSRNTDSDEIRAARIQTVEEQWGHTTSRLEDLEKRVKKQPFNRGPLWLVQAAEEDDAFSVVNDEGDADFANVGDDRANRKLGRVLGVLADSPPIKAGVGIGHGPQAAISSPERIAWCESKAGFDAELNAEAGAACSTLCGGGKKRPTLSAPGRWLRVITGAAPFPRKN